MLQITRAARAELHEMLDSALSNEKSDEREPEVGFRLVVADDADERVRLGLTLDSMRPGDDVFDHEGRHILLVDEAAAPLVEDLTLDVVDTAGGRRRLGLRGSE